MQRLSISVEACAAICHAANTAFCRYVMEDLTHKTWEKCPEDFRQLVCEGVEGVARGLNPEQLHENWRTGKLRQGWRYGEQRDASQKTHPSLVPYHDLPYKERQKDQLFYAIVLSFLCGPPIPQERLPGV